MKILHRYTQEVIFEDDSPTMRGTVENAIISRADLSGVNLSGVNLSEIKQAFYRVISQARLEVAGLRLALVEGRIDGSFYEGECACLVGTIANVRGVSYKQLKGIDVDPASPAERFFLAIQKGDTPEANPFSAVVISWIDEFMEENI
ncbi:MAG: hypothetical protein ACRC1W_01520 [Shewanella sp.]